MGRTQWARLRGQFVVAIVLPLMAGLADAAEAMSIQPRAVRYKGRRRRVVGDDVTLAKVPARGEPPDDYRMIIVAYDRA